VSIRVLRVRGRFSFLSRQFSMAKKRNKRPKLDWYLKNNAPGLLVQNGWEGIPLCWRENPCHSDELRKRVDALAHHIGKGKFDPAHKGVRARTRWAKAFSDTFR
jgi:hypothetical protein